MDTMEWNFIAQNKSNASEVENTHMKCVTMWRVLLYSSDSLALSACETLVRSELHLSSLALSRQCNSLKCEQMLCDAAMHTVH